MPNLAKSGSRFLMAGSSILGLEPGVSTIIMQQPTGVTQLLLGTNMFQHGASGVGAGNPPNGRFALLAEQANPQTGSGLVQRNTWDPGALTGFSPTDLLNCQYGFAPDGTNPTSMAQSEGGTIGAYIQSVDLPGPPPTPANSLTMMITGIVLYNAQPVYTSTGVILNASFDLQIPTATASAGANVYLNMNHQMNGPQGLRMTFNAEVFHLNSNNPGIGTTFDGQPVYVINVPLGVAGTGGYITSLGAGFQKNTWSGFRTFSWSITYTQMQNALLLLQSKFGPNGTNQEPKWDPAINPGCTDPLLYFLNNLHINAEFHHNPNVMTLGWSARNWIVTTSQ